MHFVFRAIRESYAADFSPEVLEAITELYELFDDRQNLITKVRDKVGFHADKPETLEAFAQLPSDVALGDYLAPTINNTPYWSAAVINDAVIRGLTGLDQAEALHKVMSLAQSVTSWFNTLTAGYTRVFAQRYLAPGLDQLGDHREVVDGVESLEEARLPFFVRMPGPPAC